MKTIAETLTTGSPLESFGGAAGEQAGESET